MSRYLVIYDTPSDARRRVFVKLLLRLGHRIQWSAFELDLSPAQHRTLIGQLEAAVEDGDVISVVPLPGDVKVWTYGQALPPPAASSVSL